MKQFFYTLLLLFSTHVLAQENKVILITYDGLRWQELFGGIEDSLVNDENFTSDRSTIIEKFDGKTALEKREKLFPFVWSEISKDGILLGNRYENSFVNVTNGMHFSYPGYNEIFTGFPDDKNIRSNNKIPNPNVSILEFVNSLDTYKNQVFAVASWDVFPYILNEKRSKIPVNSGYRHSLHQPPTTQELFIDKLQDQTPRRWSSVRFDVFTHQYAIEVLKNQKPKLLYIGYGETDDFAHDGDYDQYLHSAHRTDEMIKEIWEYVQNDPFYKNQTTLIITTDHGRGSGKEWTDHDYTIKGSDEVWLMAIGKDAKKIIKKDQIYSNQIAATIAEILDVKYTPSQKIGSSLLKN